MTDIDLSSAQQRLSESGGSSTQRAERIAAEQTRLLYTQAPEGFIATLVNTVLVAVFLGRVIAPSIVLSWLAVMVGVTLGRFILVRRYHQAAPLVEQAERWRRWFIVGAGCAGLGWGAAAWCLFSPESFIHQLFLAFIIGGMSMGAVVVLSSVTQAFTAFAAPALLPLIGRLLWQGDEWGIVIGALALVFLATLLAMSRRLFASITESLALRFDNLELIDTLSAHERDLATANAALRAEVAEHTQTEEKLRAARDELEARVQARTEELTRLNAELQESEEHLQIALEAARMGTWDWNILTGEVKWSKNMAALFGLAPEAFDGAYETFLNAVHPEDGEHVSQAIARAIAERTPYDIEFRVVWPNGTVRWAASTGQVFYDAVGKAVRMAGVDLDITERKRLEDETHAQAAMLRLLINNLPAFISYIDADQRYRLVNRGYEEWFLRPREQIEGRLVSDIQPAAAYQTIQPHLEKALAGEQVRYEHLLQDEAGNSRYLDNIYIPHRSTDGAVVGCFVMVSDITEQKQAETELRRAKERAETANQAKSEFLATISHELRTPLNVILGYTDILLDGGFGALTSAQAATLQRIDKNAHELFELISLVLDLQRLETARLPVEIQAVYVPDFLAALETETHSLRAQTELAFVWRMEEPLPIVYTDPPKLKVVLKNLLGNAVKFTPQGQITLVVRRRDEGVEFRVTDTGVGIPQDALSRIFEAFQQVEGSQQQNANGVGLGLYIVKRLLELLQGRVMVESEVGQGSTFRVWIPITLEASVALADKPNTVRGFSG